MDENGLGSSSVADISISGTEPSGSVTSERLNRKLSLRCHVRK